MSTLALNITLTERLAVVIGGGSVALRKVRTLLAAGARVRIIAPEIHRELTALATTGELTVLPRIYQAGDLDQAFLAVAATDNPTVNRQIADDATKAGLLVAVADNPALGSCTFPALLQRGNLEITVSTGGTCPAFAVAVRDYLGGLIGDDFADALDRLAAEREKLLTNGSSNTYNSKVLRSLAGEMLAKLTESKEPAP